MGAPAYGLYLGGKWVTPKGRKTFETTNPTTGEVLATFVQGTREDVHRAIDAAEAAFTLWRRVPAPERAMVALRAAQLLRGRKQEVGELVTREMGKVLTEGLGDVQESIDFLEYIHGEGRRLLGETTPSELKDKFCMTVRQPIGVAGLITPWNFPTAIPVWKIGAAMVSGNAMVFKPASVTPLCAATLVGILEEAGLPPGVLNMVTGPGSTVGDEIASNPRIRVISFTGSVEAGRQVYQASSRHLKPVELELGGKNPQIVMDDANLDLAIEGALFGAFGTSGQRCTATSRLIVHAKVFDDVKKRLLKATAGFTVGDPLQPKVRMGPVSSKEQFETVMRFIEVGKKEGTLLTGGKRLTGGAYDKGYFIAPTIFETTHGTRISKEEIFGPVLSLIRVGSYEEAVRVANDVDYGLSSSIYTASVNLAFRAIEDFQTGITYINAPTIGAEVHLPFGGTKNTGNGGREAGSSAIEEFTEIKTVFVDYSNRLQKAQGIE